MRIALTQVPLLWLILSVLLLGPVAAADPATESTRNDPKFAATVQPFLAQYCTKCHGSQRQKGERRFDLLATALPEDTISDDDTLVDLQDILDQLNLAEMPPADERQPTPTERLEVIHWLTQRIEQYHLARQRTAGGTVLRRLNAREYRNTIGDLLKLNMTMFDPTVGFPRDKTVSHLDNTGEALVTSGYLLGQYLTAAELAIGKALYPLQKPPVQKWVFRDGFRQQPEVDKVHRSVNNYEHITLYDVVGADKPEGAYGPILAFQDGVPTDGEYEIRILAEAVNRLHPYDPEFLGTDRDEPLRLGIVPGNILAGALHKPQPIEPLLAELDLEDEPKWYSIRVWLDAGYSPRFTFRNGLMDVRSLWSRLLREYPDQFPKRKSGGIVEARMNAIKYGKLPQIHIHEVEIEGPFFEAWPKESQRVLLGDDWKEFAGTEAPDQKRMRRQLEAFISRAYRRPARTDEVDRILQLVAARQAEGRTHAEAYGDGLQAILCSPHFLYLEEVGDAELSPHALAARLSYFLWSSMPDEELTELATDHRLLQPDVLAAQVERMLDDPRSAAFISGFLDSWLTLRDLGSTPPDRTRFRDYYHYDLQAAMRRETTLFTRHLLDENLPIARFLDADFTFANNALARLYGLDAPKSYEFQYVQLDDRRRGGLLGQASVMTVTANGIDTSPVVRGVWLLENLLGTPPTPPPPDVEPLDPDIRGALTIRDQLQKHRDVPSCYDCHRKIDPLGFALENFDPIGGWRETYGGRKPIDATGTLPNGQSFSSIEQFKTLLAEQQPQFARSLTSKLFSYAVGRQTDLSDRPHIDQIVEELQTKDRGFRDLIHEVVLSEPFRRK